MVIWFREVQRLRGQTSFLYRGCILGRVFFPCSVQVALFRLPPLWKCRGLERGLKVKRPPMLNDVSRGLKLMKSTFTTLRGQGYFSKGPMRISIRMNWGSEVIRGS